eukprot:m51a1_g8403 hypothetical protein (239) ;mRNA; r:242013-243220
MEASSSSSSSNAQRIDVDAFTEYVASLVIDSRNSSPASSPSAPIPEAASPRRTTRRTKKSPSASEPYTTRSKARSVKSEPKTPRAVEVKEEDEEKRMRRVMRNRASAVASRQRRKDRVAELTDIISASQRTYADNVLQLARLEAEHNALKKELEEVRKMIWGSPVLSRMLSGVLQVAAALLARNVALTALATSGTTAGKEAIAQAQAQSLSTLMPVQMRTGLDPCAVSTATTVLPACY